VSLALASGLLELIPILGPSASATLLGAAAVLHGGGAWMYLGLALYWFCLRMVIDQVVGPLVLGQAVNLHPVVVIFAFLSGGVLFGLLGVLLAIPTAATLKVFLDNYYALPIEE
jgi:predicted PurR-regulated permease PerM